MEVKATTQGGKDDHCPLLYHMYGKGKFYFTEVIATCTEKRVG